MNVLDYRMKRHLLFAGLKAGGLDRESEDEPQYRVAIGGSKPVAPDWGYEGKTVLFQQRADCHMGRGLERLGVASILSIVHLGGFDAGAMMGVTRALSPDQNCEPIRANSVRETGAGWSVFFQRDTLPLFCRRKCLCSKQLSTRHCGRSLVEGELK